MANFISEDFEAAVPAVHFERESAALLPIFLSCDAVVVLMIS